MNEATVRKRASFRQLHSEGFFILPNAWDAGSARRLQNLNFRAIASTSAGAAWSMGKEDGELTLTEVLSHLGTLVAATDLPVNADFENGFADEPDAVAANVVSALETGVAGISIEDWSGNAMYDTEHAADRIAAARVAIDAVDRNIMLIGRTENFRVAGMSASESIARAVAYSQAGADCLFVPFILDRVAIKELVAAVAPKPINVVVHDYNVTIDDLAALGVRRCSVGGSLAKKSWGAFDTAAQLLKSYDP